MMKFIYTLLILFPAQVYSCGYPEWFFNRYWSSEISREQKIEVLSSPECSGHTNYFPRTADPLIAKVLIDAIKNDFPRETIESALQGFHCAYGARQETDYLTIRSFISEEHYSEFCNQEKLNKIYIIDVESGAALRSGPSTNADKINSIRKGDFVEKLGDNEEWLHVMSRHYGEGYIHASLLSRY